MAIVMNSKEYCVAGIVKCRPNKDGSTTFTVAGKRGQRFTLSDSNDHSKVFRSARRVLVRYEAGGSRPKVKLVLKEPSHRLIREHMEQCKP